MSRPRCSLLPELFLLNLEEALKAALSVHGATTSTDLDGADAARYSFGIVGSDDLREDYSYVLEWKFRELWLGARFYLVGDPAMVSETSLAELLAAVESGVLGTTLVVPLENTVDSLEIEMHKLELRDRIAVECVEVGEPEEIGNASEAE